MNAGGAGSSRPQLSFSPASNEDDIKAIESSIKAHQGYIQDKRADKAQQWSQQDAHQLRLKELRTSLLKHIQDTDWMYQPLDKFIGKQ